MVVVPGLETGSVDPLHKVAASLDSKSMALPPLALSAVDLSQVFLRLRESLAFFLIDEFGCASYRSGSTLAAFSFFFSAASLARP